jgi:hypothetical protein
MKRAAQNFLLALLNGFILFFYSERLFWSAWRPGDSIPDLMVTWLAYSVLAYLFLATVWFFRVNHLWSVFLAGAVYGWLTEGGLIHTLYGTEETAPFPVSISITGLSWHALIYESSLAGLDATRGDGRLCRRGKTGNGTGAGGVGGVLLDHRTRRNASADGGGSSVLSERGWETRWTADGRAAGTGD